MREAGRQVPAIDVAGEAKAGDCLNQNRSHCGYRCATGDLYDVEHDVVPPVYPSKRITDICNVSEARQRGIECFRQAPGLFEVAAQLAAQLVSAFATRNLGGFNNAFDERLDVVTHRRHQGSTAWPRRSAATAGALIAPAAGLGPLDCSSDVV